MGLDGFVFGPSGCRVSLTMLARGDVSPFFFASTQLLVVGGWSHASTRQYSDPMGVPQKKRRLVVEVMEGGLGFNRRSVEWR